MEKWTIEHIKENGWLVLEVITGSRSYGLDTATSDTDIKGVFILPRNYYYGLEYTGQVNNATNDIVYYELRRFMELLARNNPNILEMLFTPHHCVLYRHELMDRVVPALFLSKLCEQTFANYAYTQIKKAAGLEKKIVNPVEPEKKSVLDFCYVYDGQAAVPLNEYLNMHQLSAERAGLAAIDHLRDTYNLYYSGEHAYAGIVRKEASNDICLSSIPKGETPNTLLYFNKDGYSVYCRKYKEYWEWVGKRNEARYNTTMAHGKNYDAKNMMHVFRLLRIAREIATERSVHVHRSDREYLLAIKEGQFEYDDLLTEAEALRNELPGLYWQSDLADAPDIAAINQLLVEMRLAWYDLNLSIPNINK